MEVLNFLFCIFIIFGGLALAGLLIWLVLGRGKRGEKGMIGTLDKQAVFKGTTGNGGPRMK